MYGKKTNGKKVGKKADLSVSGPLYTNTNEVQTRGGGDLGKGFVMANPSPFTMGVGSTAEGGGLKSTLTMGRKRRSAY